MTAINILSDRVMPISEAKRNPMALAKDTEAGPVAVLNRNRPVMYCLSPALYEEILDRLEDAQLARVAEERLTDGSEAIPVSLDDL
ncbi:type II toxin-antitoxin system Phd/YefM family antitoxin [Microbulbifer sp. 2201CG32-9]|uniref:type II toxin-antitoxin system Phd/YefM family antitoxin n=1 Tax=unclassified Microbulbifer TaxID=2619833 RepID=UPI00345C3EF6